VDWGTRRIEHHGVPEEANETKPFSMDEGSSTLADNLSRLLGMHRMSVTELARGLGISRQTVSQWTNGRYSPGLKAALSLQWLFEIEMLQLVETSFVDLLPIICDAGRYDRIELRIEEMLGEPRRSAPGA
jgi:DNA-binding XRE family transcriptional regulator